MMSEDIDILLNNSDSYGPQWFHLKGKKYHLNKWGKGQ